MHNSMRSINDNRNTVMNAFNQFYCKSFSMIDDLVPQQNNFCDCGPIVIKCALDILNRVKFSSFTKVREYLRLAVKLLFNCNTDPLFYQMYSVPCNGLQHRCLSLITENDCINCNDVLVATRKYKLHSTSCKGISNGYGVSDECHKLRQQLKQRLQRLEALIDSNTLIERRLIGNETNNTLRAYIDSYRKNCICQSSWNRAMHSLYEIIWEQVLCNSL